MSTILNLLQRANAWVGRNVLYIAVGVFLLGLVVVGAVNYFGRKAEQAMENNPPLPRKVATKIRADSKAAEAQAQAYQRLARRRAAQRDSALRLARLSKRQADSLLSLREKLPATSTGPLPAIALDLRNYQSPDTSR